MIQYLQELLDSSSTPLLTAFLLGILTAINPCPLATNITAMGYISKNIENRRSVFWNGMIYTLGRTLSYTILGTLLIFLIHKGTDIFSIQKGISKYGEMVIAPALLIFGLLILFGDKLPLPSFGFSGKTDRINSNGKWGSLTIGMLFAMAFCPTSGMLYFGMLIPLSAQSSAGYLLPIIYAVATGLPVIIIAWIIAFCLSEVGNFYNKMKIFQKWFNRFVASLFIIVGLYYAYIFYIE
jgi:cytochrome c-type biogenesis protein